MTTVDDPADPRVALYTHVADGELLRAHGLFCAEGRLVVQRVLEDERYRVRSVLVNAAAARDMASRLSDANVPVYVGDTAMFASLTGYHLHRGCLALVERPAPMAPAALHRATRLVVLEGVTNADNVGGVFRNAAAFGAGGVLLDPASCDPLYRKAIRTSMGATLTVPFARAADWPAAIDALRAAGYVIAALTPREPSLPIETFATTRADAPLALLIGGEGPGLSDEALARADVRVRITTTGAVDSLNLAVAAGIALHRLA